METWPEGNPCLPLSTNVASPANKTHTRGFIQTRLSGPTRNTNTIPVHSVALPGIWRGHGEPKHAVRKLGRNPPKAFFPTSVPNCEDNPKPAMQQGSIKTPGDKWPTPASNTLFQVNLAPIEIRFAPKFDEVGRRCTRTHQELA
jgi:hypothetical protein